MLACDDSREKNMKECISDEMHKLNLRRREDAYLVRIIFVSTKLKRNSCEHAIPVMRDINDFVIFEIAITRQI